MESKKRYLYLIAKSEMEADLIDAECFALTKAHPDVDGIAISENKVDISRGAYVKSCMEIIFRAESLEGLYQNIEEAKLQADDFRVSITKIPRRLELDSMKVAKEIGACIEGKPDLDNPKVVFLLVAKAGQLWFGKVTSESDRAWIKHIHKPYTTSSSLPARLCGAVVNIIANVGDSLIDPCCGAGTILLEAAQMGIKVVGYDINPKMVASSQKNLEHFCLEGAIYLGDARYITGEFDALVIDFPYGMCTHYNDKLYREILQNVKSLSPIAAFITAKDITDLLSELDYEVRQVILTPKSNFTRYIHIGEGNSHNRRIGREKTNCQMKGVWQ